MHPDTASVPLSEKMRCAYPNPKCNLLDCINNCINNIPRQAKQWRHEDASVAMFLHMLDVNNLRQHFATSGLTERDIMFICEQIAGKPWSECGGGGEAEGEGGGPASAAATPPSSQPPRQAGVAGGASSGNWSFSGREAGKRYLYEIVNNPRNGAVLPPSRPPITLVPVKSEIRNVKHRCMLLMILAAAYTTCSRIYYLQLHVLPPFPYFRIFS